MSQQTNRLAHFEPEHTSSQEYFAEQALKINNSSMPVYDNSEVHQKDKDPNTRIVVIGSGQSFKEMWSEIKGRNYGKTATFKNDLEEFMKMNEVEQNKTIIELEKQVELHRDNRRHHTIRRNPHKHGGNLILAKKKRKK